MRFGVGVVLCCLGFLPPTLFRNCDLFLPKKKKEKKIKGIGSPDSIQQDLDWNGLV